MIANALLRYGLLTIAFWVIPPSVGDAGWQREGQDPRILHWLDARDLSGAIKIFDVQLVAGKLVFHFSLIDHSYTIAETGENYLELSVFQRPDAKALWIKLFMAISDISGMPLGSIEGLAIREPWQSSICSLRVWFDNGLLAEDGQWCGVSAMAAIPTHIRIVHGSADLAPGIDIRTMGRPTIEQIFKLTLEFFKRYGVSPSVRERSNRHIVLGAYGLKNAVIIGEGRWEEVSFYIVDVSEPSNSEFELFIVSDGYFASGIGGPPPITSYTNPMEPKYFKQLEEFANRFGEYIRERLLGR